MSQATRSQRREQQLVAERRKKKWERQLLKHLRYGDDPILKQACADVTDVDEAKRIGDLMRGVIEVCPTAVGLAAPQVGIAKRVIVLWPNRNREQGSLPILMVNPCFLTHSDAVSLATEGCLSYPGRKAVVDRYTWVNVAFQIPTPNGFATQEKRLEGFDARVFLHEWEHLSGVCRVRDDNPNQPLLTGILSEPERPRQMPPALREAVAACLGTR